MDDRVLIIYPPGLEFISAFFGCLYAGVIVVPAYPPSTKELIAKLLHIIKNSESRVVITTKDILQQIKKLLTDKRLDLSNFLDPSHEQREEFFSPQIFQLGWYFEKLLFITSDDLPNRDGHWRNPSLTQDNIALLQYTSGSTGKPKGVMIRHSNLLHNLSAIEKAIGITEDDSSVSWLPPYHDMGLIGGILQPLFSSVPVKLMSPLTFLQRPAFWLEIISLYQITGTVAPNFAYDLCVTKVTEEEKSQLDLSSLQFLMSGAEPIRKATIDRFIECFSCCRLQEKAFFPCYGLAESTLIVTGGSRKQGINSQLLDNKALSQGNVIYCDESHPDARRLINCGLPVDGFHLAIVNPKTLQECPERMVGEIWVASQSVAQGYWQLPNETKHHFNAYIASNSHSFLRTGDLGYLDKGSLYVTGRLKDIIIIHGRNYYPHDLEESIHICHPHLRVNCCAIFAIEEKDHESLVIVQEIKEEVKSLNTKEMVRKIRSTLLNVHGLIADVVLLVRRKSVPKTTSGKIQRVLCKKKYLEGDLDIIYRDNISNNETENNLLDNQRNHEAIDTNSSDIAQILEPIFNVDILALDEEKRLSELGLSSVKLGELQYVISTWTGNNISLEFLLMDPSLKEIMDLLVGKIDYRKLTNNNQIDLISEFEKYKNITTNITSLPKPILQQALLTGSTGFLGAYLLQELLVNTSWSITCLVQASSETDGISRIIKNMENYGVWDPAYFARIRVVLGNLEQHKLGLAMQDWERLADDIDLIFHSAAVLNFIYPYQKLLASNVLGTKQLLELAGYKQLKALHYVSTIGYFMSADLADDVVVSEQTELDPEEGIYGGYNQTKWLAERLVFHARTYNIPTVIYRPSLITGESKTGYWNQADVVCRILKGCIQLGARPILDANLNFVPVDYVAKAIVCFAKENPYHVDTYHLINPQEIGLDQLFGYVGARGFKVEAITYPDWEKMIKENSGFDLDNSFSPLRPFFIEKVSNKNSSLFNLYLHNNKAKIDSTYTKSKLTNHEIHCKRIDESLLNKYLDYLINCGYLTQSITEEEITN